MAAYGIPGPSRAKLGRTAWQQLLTLASLGQAYFVGVICHASDWKRVYLPKSKWGQNPTDPIGFDGPASLLGLPGLFMKL